MTNLQILDAEGSSRISDQGIKNLNLKYLNSNSNVNITFRIK